MKPHHSFFICALSLLCLITTGDRISAQSKTSSLGEQLIAAFKAEDFTLVLSLTEKTKSPIRHEARSEAFERRGEQRFFAGKIKESIADFDQYIALNPEREPHHWQRGIAYYYAGSYTKGKAQFEIHQTVNSQDVENAVWHFLCAVRAPGGQVEQARKKFIPIDSDQRIPMKEIHDLFSGSGSEQAVLDAARSGKPNTENLRNQLCYAHLYLGLYYEALGQKKKSTQHIKLAAKDYRMDHYMGKVAQVHAQLRGIK